MRGVVGIVGEVALSLVVTDNKEDHAPVTTLHQDTEEVHAVEQILTQEDVKLKNAQVYVHCNSLQKISKYLDTNISFCSMTMRI